MKLVLFETPAEPARYGLLAPDGVLSLRDLLPDDATGDAAAAHRYLRRAPPTPREPVQHELDVMARGDQQFGRDFWLAKADTLGPLGPCIVTADELTDPGVLRVRSWQNGTPAQDFLIGDASHSIPEQVEFATTVMTLYSGDVLVCGTSPEGQRALADADRVEVEIDGIGRLAVNVADVSRRNAA